MSTMVAMPMPDKPERRRTTGRAATVPAGDDDYMLSLVKVYIGLVCRRNVEMARRIMQVIRSGP